MNSVYNMPNMAQDINQLTFVDYYTRLMLLAQTVFQWEGLPNGIDEKHIERYLYAEGRCMFFRDFEKGWMVAKCTDSGRLNYYDEPTTLRPVATNYYPEDMGVYMNGEDCAIIYNNAFAIPTHRTIYLYAMRLAAMQRTIDININAQKTPVLIKTTEKQRETVRAVYRQWSGNEPVIYGDRNLDALDDMKTLNTAAPVVFDKLAIEKNKLWNECMTFLGVNNANMDKRERLVDDEVQANNQQIMLSANIMLKSRQAAAEAMSKLCGCNITVKLRECLQPIQGGQEGPQALLEGGVEE